MIDNYYKRQIRPFVLNIVEKFVDQYGYDVRMDLDNLADSDISKFAAILMAENPGDLSEITWNDALYSCMQAALRTMDKEDALILAEKQIEALITYFKPQMYNILDEVHKSVVAEWEDTRGVDL